MKIPGVGEVKNKNVAIGGGVVGAIVIIAYVRRKKRVTTSMGTSVDPNAIDPATGVPYGQEVGGGGGYYTNASIPNPYVSQAGTQSTTGTGGQFANNELWLADAIQDATNLFGVSYGLATIAFGKYLSQDMHGLSADEYQAVSEVVATIGQPPNGGPYRLIQAPPPVTSPPPTLGGGGGSEPGDNPEPKPSPQPAPVWTSPGYTPPPLDPNPTPQAGQAVPNPPPPLTGQLPGYYGGDLRSPRIFWDGIRWIYE